MGRFPTIMMVLPLFWLAIGCTQKLTVSPKAVSPGDQIQIIDQDAEFDQVKALRITVGEEAASVVSVEATTIRAIVPNTPPGSAAIRVRSGSNILATGRVTILPPNSRRVTLSIKDGEIRLMRSSTQSGGFDENAEPEGMRLAYDVLTADGNLLYSGAIPHPTKGRLEVFDDPESGRMHGAAPLQESVFSFKIPYIDGRTVIRFYEAGPGLDLSQPQAREQREFLEEIVIDDE